MYHLITLLFIVCSCSVLDKRDIQDSSRIIASSSDLASSKTCSELLTSTLANKNISEKQIQDYKSLTGDTKLYGLSLSEGREKRLRIFSEDSWGAPANLGVDNISILVNVEGIDDAKKTLAELLGKDISWEEGRMSVILNEKVRADIIGTSDQTPGVSDFQELRITFIDNVEKEDIREILSRLSEKLNLRTLGYTFKDFSEVSNNEKREWAYYSYIGWANALETVEVRALQSLSTGEYKAIHSALRNGQTPEITKHIDSAIEKAATNRPIRLYRAVDREDLNIAFEEVHGGTKSASEVEIDKDPAYIFSSLDNSVAEWWKKSMLDDKGLILEIEVPEGYSAAFIDAKRIQENRGYMEFVLGRNTSFEVVGTEIRDGQKVLKMKVVDE